MTPYIGCEYARECLEALVDGELPLDEQVAVESHLRWCRTCGAHVEDLQIIGASMRLGSPASAVRTISDQDLTALHAGVLARVRAEREMAIGVRLRELCTDMRFLWPAMGATCAVVLCICAAVFVLRSATIERPESLAARLAAMTSPGSERNPLRPDNNARIDSYFAKYVDSDRAGGISMPRVLHSGGAFAALGDREAMFTMATVVSREGRIANLELLRTDRLGEMHDGDVAAVLAAVRQSRFAPAQTPMGRAVAVNMVWLFVVTTVQQDAVEPQAPRAPEPVANVATRRRLPVPAGDTPLPLPAPRQSSRAPLSPTA